MAIRSKTFCESYHEDIKLMNTIWSKVWMGLFAAGMLVLPFATDTYIVYLVNLSCIATVAALGRPIGAVRRGCTPQRGGADERRRLTSGGHPLSDRPGDG